MPRRARIVIPGAIHHVTQRGTRKQQTFYCPEDYVLYRDLLAERCEMHGVELLQYCLMPNHVHLLLRPSDSAGMSLALKVAHAMYARRVNLRNDWTGHLWQSRYWSHAVFGNRVLTAARYVAQNPIRHGVVTRLADWRASSVPDLLDQYEDPWISSRAVRGYLGDWSRFLATLAPSADTALMRQHTRSGEPMLPHREGRRSA